MSISSGGYMGKLLRVNLTDGKLTDVPLSDDFLKEHFGGTLMGVKILYDEVPPEAGPFDAENKVIITTGPLAGITPASTVWNSVTKGPLTGLIGSAQCNGFFAIRLKSAGYDGIIIEGKSPEWKYLVIDNGKAELRDASHLLGKTTYETEEFLKEEVGLPKCSVACIGPAGENMVRFANIFADEGHFAATNGQGAVLGSKKLKAIVANGSMKVPVFDNEKVKELSKAWIETSLAGSGAQALKVMGTMSSMFAAPNVGWCAVKNLTTDEFPFEKFMPKAYMSQTDKYSFKPDPCYKCHVGHCKKLTIKEGPYAGTVMDEPEYEGYTGFGTNLGNEDVTEAMMANYLTDSFGMCIKETSFTLSWAIECYENGYITKEDTNGLELTWGNMSEIKKLIKKIAHRDGSFANMLAEGVARASKAVGGKAADCAVYCKTGIAPHVHDPRGLYSFIFSQTVSDMGSTGSIPDMGPDPVIGYDKTIPPRETVEHPKALVRGLGTGKFSDSAIVCILARSGIPELAECVNAVTGWNIDVEDAVRYGQKASHLMRAYNIRCGLTADGDYVSTRLQEAPRNGPAAGEAFGPVMDGMKRAFYGYNGWDVETSKPLPETLDKFGLGYVIKDIWEEK